MIISRRPGLLFPAWLRRPGVPVLAGAGVVAIAVFLDRLVLHIGLNGFLLVPLALIAVTVVVVFRSAESDQHLHRLSKEEHSELHELVSEVADALAVRRPRRIWAWARPDSVAVRPIPGRSELWLGLPYLTEMSPDELKAVIAHELTLLEQRRSWLVDASYALWRAEVERRGTMPADVAAIAISVLRTADEAGARLMGTQITVSALRRGALITNSFTWFAVRYAWPLVTMRGYPADLYKGWRWKVHDDGFLERFVRSVAEDGRPGSMAARIVALGSGLDGALPVAERVLPVRLPEEIEARLARSYLRKMLPAQYTAARAMPFRDVPEDEWDAVVEQQLAEVSAAVATLLNRQAVTVREIIDVVVAGRAGEIVWDHRTWLCTHSGPEACALFPVFHRELRKAGYRYDHPLRQRLLIAGDGERVDVVALAERVAGGEPLPDRMRHLVE
ncbi:M48 family metallopeptidase [Streptosporangium subroseum]|uniref:M48 family metallopeptidase n=1 Tax=Streptosporangium subroseum TaxID=106412 RepID=UPI003444D3CC